MKNEKSGLHFPPSPARGRKVPRRPRPFSGEVSELAAGEDEEAGEGRWQVREPEGNVVF